MAFRCSTPDLIPPDPNREWHSRLEPDGVVTPLVPYWNDGVIKINREDPNTGRFTGLHRQSLRPINGTCFEAGGHHRIEFDRDSEDGAFTYHYHGDIIETDNGHHKIISGRYEKNIKTNRLSEKEAAAPRPPVEEGTWEGQKPIT